MHPPRPPLHAVFALLLAASCLPPHTARAADTLGIFAPFVPLVPPSQTRSAGGIPGPAYWQNHADTHIDAAIDPATHTLRGTEIITYTNNSPDPLDVLWLQLDQNIYRPDARASALPDRPPHPDGAFTQGDTLDAITIEQAGHTTRPAQLVSDTRLQLRLATPLASHATLRLHIAWHYTVPGTWGGRTAVSPTPDGDIYEIAQWFPRMAVYDDLRGWDTAPYLGSEFYLEYGDIDYAITVPAGWIVVGSGALANPAEMLDATERARLAQAVSSDRTIAIRTAADVAQTHARPPPGLRTWRFHMAQTRDVAFAASPAFMWDAARATLPDGRRALVQSVYPRGSIGPTKWDRATEYTRFAIEHFSARYFAYPWPAMTNVGGFGAAMEYPGIVFDGQLDAGRDLFWITVHEVGHSWFPMIVGSNERRDAWMDEGFNTFIDVEASDAFNHGEFGPKRDPEYAPGGGNPADEIAPLLSDPQAPPILTAADQITEHYRHLVSYFKPAFGLHLLRDLILGPDRFDPAFRRYIAAWAYKHPSPSDFFRLMQSEAGEDLGWFWRGWFATNAPLHITLVGFRAVAGGVQLHLVSSGPLVLPVPVRLGLADGTHIQTTVPVEAFLHGGETAVTLSAPHPVTAVTMDPDHTLPQAR